MVSLRRRSLCVGLLPAVFAAAGCATSIRETAAAPEPEPPLLPAVEQQSILVAVNEVGEVRVFVDARSAEEAQARRPDLLAFHARMARQDGKWGLLVAPEWREIPRGDAPPQETPRDALIARIAERFGTVRHWTLDVTYLDGPVANPDGTVYAVADLITDRPTPGVEQ